MPNFGALDAGDAVVVIPTKGVVCACVGGRARGDVEEGGWCLFTAHKLWRTGSEVVGRSRLSMTVESRKLCARGFLVLVLVVWCCFFIFPRGSGCQVAAGFLIIMFASYFFSCHFFWRGRDGRGCVSGARGRARLEGPLARTWTVVQKRYTGGLRHCSRLPDARGVGRRVLVRLRAVPRGRGV